jgi:hypothetical protein
MADEFDGHHDPRFTALYRGSVVSNDDPEKLGRVKVQVPGLIEPESAWALPFTIGGGSEDSGLFWVPEVGAEVAVFFHQGDVDEPHYIAGNWRAPNGSSTAPERARGKSAGEVHKVKVIETERWLIILDGSTTTPALIMKDKVSGDGIEYNALTRSMTINGTAALNITSVGNITIRGLGVTINGRPVLPSTDPI